MLIRIRTERGGVENSQYGHVLTSDFSSFLQNVAHLLEDRDSDGTVTESVVVYRNTYGLQHKITYTKE